METISVNLFNDSYEFNVDSNNTNSKESVDYLIEKVNSVKEQVGENISFQEKIAILAMVSLNITKDYFELKKKYEACSETFSDRSNKIIQIFNKEN